MDSAWQWNYDLPFNLSNFMASTYYVRTTGNNFDLSRETLYVYIMNTLDK